MTARYLRIVLTGLCVVAPASMPPYDNDPHGSGKCRFCRSMLRPTHTDVGSAVLAGANNCPYIHGHRHTGILSQSSSVLTCRDLVIPASMTPYDIRPTRMWEVQFLQEQITARTSMDIVAPASCLLATYGPSMDIKKGRTMALPFQLLFLSVSNKSLNNAQIQ
jgi:hypothetical protein